MKIFLDENELDDEYKSLSLSELLDSVKNDIEDKIIKHIFINGVEVNEKYLDESFIEDDIESIKFVTQEIDVLIEETLNEVDEYLPKLRSGILETAELFRNGDTEKANDKYQKVSEGIEWYSQVIIKILSLLEEENLYEKVESSLNELNKVLIEIVKAHKKDDIVLIADMLEYEIVDFVDEFIEINKKVKRRN